ncbi:unnamed protein product [Chrysoparadoxa australica]
MAYQGRAYPNAYKQQQIPGFIEAELFDRGGQGVAYNELPDNANLPPNVIRAQERGQPVAVQINDVGPGGGGSEAPGEIAVGMIITGEWMRYTVTVGTGGLYLPTYRIASFSPEGGTIPVGIKLALNAEDSIAPCDQQGVGQLDLQGINTGNWKDFESYEGAPFEIGAGKRVITLCFDNVLNFEINYIEMDLLEEYEVDDYVPRERNYEELEQVPGVPGLPDQQWEDQPWEVEDDPEAQLRVRDPRCKEDAPCDFGDDEEPDGPPQPARAQLTTTLTGESKASFSEEEQEVFLVAASITAKHLISSGSIMVEDADPLTIPPARRALRSSESEGMPAAAARVAAAVDADGEVLTDGETIARGGSEQPAEQADRVGQALRADASTLRWLQEADEGDEEFDDDTLGQIYVVGGKVPQIEVRYDVIATSTAEVKAAVARLNYKGGTDLMRGAHYQSTEAVAFSSSLQ